MYGDNAKYIVIKQNGYDEVIIFPATIEHRKMQRLNGRAISAGFINCNLQCFGESLSLLLKSRPEEDTRLVMNMFGTDEEDLNLQRQ